MSLLRALLCAHRATIARLVVVIRRPVNLEVIRISLDRYGVELELKCKNRFVFAAPTDIFWCGIISIVRKKKKQFS